MSSLDRTRSRLKIAAFTIGVIVLAWIWAHGSAAEYFRGTARSEQPIVGPFTIDEIRAGRQFTPVPLSQTPPADGSD